MAAEPAKPNTLTAEEQAAGWILLFDGETTFGWELAGDNVQVANGILVVGGDRAVTAATTSSFGEGEWRFQYRYAGAKRDAQAQIKGASRALPAIKDSTSWIDAAVRIENGKVLYAFASAGQELPHAIGNSGDPKLVTPLRFVTHSNTKIELRSIKFKPLGMSSLFNGKNLDGWKVFAGDKKRDKSKFTVTREGWLNVQNGPGDLQTTGQWADFVLQLECISNGKHLNSGIFFRCLPRQYQQGYEAQIRNQWMGDDRAKPVDFGTGAIYRRQAARRVVSTDGEWFTLTLIAHGKHLATWVNGYAVTDFTDKREKHENPRQGAKTGKGPISIQGHDPTTNLSFRNIRLAELK